MVLVVWVGLATIFVLGSAIIDLLIVFRRKKAISDFRVLLYRVEISLFGWMWLSAFFDFGVGHL